MTNAPEKIALIGFGEVGQTFASDFFAAGTKEVTAWDIAFSNPASAQRTAAHHLGVAVAGSSAEALRGQRIVISAVTAASAETAARKAAEAIAPDALYADVNSVSPGTKQSIAKIIEARGTRFVEIAIMSPITPRGIRSPMLLGGPHAEDFIAAMRALNPDMTAVSKKIGRAAATKMCRSVMYKGIEALLLESMIAARHYGIEKDVLASLKNLLERGWPETARYMISRALIHGRRRAEEMREAAKTVAEAGLAPLVTERVAARQDWAADESAHLVGIRPNAASLAEMLDALLAKAPAASK